MKRIIPVLIVSCLLLSVLSGCARNGSDARTGDKISIISTIFAPYDFVRQIAGEHADITMLLPPGSESHSYEPTPKEIIAIQNCDVFIYVGGDSDSWVHEVLESIDTGKMKIITLMDCVDVVETEIVEGMEDDHDHSHDDAQEDGGHSSSENADDHTHDADLDEHVWTSPKNAKIIVQKVSAALCETDAANATSYTDNTASYLALLDDLDARFREIVDSAVHRTMIFGDRFPFRYFADAYGLEYFAAFPGCSTETEASAATVAFLIDKVRDEDIPAVFHVELSNKKMAYTISEETGAKVLLFHACHNITRDEMAQGITYIELMNRNAENLREALN